MMTNRPTKSQFEEYMSRYHKQMGLETPPEGPEIPDVGPESTLQGKIWKWATERGHPCLSFHMSKKAKGFIPPGWPDITLILPGRVIFIELKSKTGRLSPEQKLTKLEFMHHGHEIHVVRSFVRFLEVVQRSEIS